MRRRKKKSTLIYLLFILLLSIAIGYALLTQNLSINGITKVRGNTFDIHFDNIQVNSNSVTLSTGDVAAAINQSDNTLVEYTVTLNLPGDFYEFTVDAVNAGTVDGMIGSITSKYNNAVISTTNPLPTYIDYSVTYENGVALAPNHLLEHGDSETFKIRVEFKRDIENNELPATLQTLSFSFEVNYVQADSNATYKPAFILPAGRTANNLQVGDEICTSGDTTECFNFIRYDGNDVVLLSKYNLKVGYIMQKENNSHNNIYLFSTSDTGYGLQDSEMIGGDSYPYNKEYWKGVAAFTAFVVDNHNYWSDNNGLKAKYGSSYPADVYDSYYSTEPDFSSACNNTDNCWYTSGYSIAYFVERYKNTLNSTGYKANIKNARLLTYSEATDSSIGCDFSNHTCPTNSFITNTTFYLGTAYDNVCVYYILDAGSFFYNYPWSTAYGLGARPVIVIEKTNLG